MGKIIIEEIAVKTAIGVTDKERSKPQRVLISVELETQLPYNEIQDKLENTVNYSSVIRDVKNLLKTSNFGLIETAAGKIAHLLKDNYKVKRVTICVKKFPYRNTKYCAYKLTV